MNVAAHFQCSNVTPSEMLGIDQWYMYLHHQARTTVKPPNKGHARDNINSAVLSFIEGLSLLEILNLMY